MLLYNVYLTQYLFSMGVPTKPMFIAFLCVRVKRIAATSVLKYKNESDFIGKSI